jgi:hypothetical protein
VPVLEKLYSRRSIGENHHEGVSNILCILTVETQNVRAIAIYHTVTIPRKPGVALHIILSANGILLIKKQSGSVMGTAITNLGRGYRATVWKA